jgi:HD-like signal output (HDOD) protein
VIPEAMVRVNQVVQDPEASRQDLVVAITNPTVAARILQVANSPALRRRPVKLLAEAVTFLGMDLTKNIVTCASMRDLFSCRNLFLRTRVSFVWQHSVEIASIAVILAKRFRVPVGQAMSASMLHDIGVLPIADYFERFKCDTNLFTEVVDLVSVDLGEAILRRWEFPDDFVRISHASTELPSERTDIFDLVSAAHYLVDTNVDRLTPLGLTPEEFAELVDSDERLALLSDMV